MGIDALTQTDPEMVPHAFQSGYAPEYTLRNASRGIVMDGNAEYLMKYMHVYPERELNLHEDKYPVMSID
ncbi:hypothetical protein ABT282_07015 [Streptomyces sp. NPDC000927]|uniref:hypothetical protein n=1 Tax=Streptomyces sp. NPDC000927 TaxID=3154371 RepID=UPI003334758C